MHVGFVRWPLRWVSVHIVHANARVVFGCQLHALYGAERKEINAVVWAHLRRRRSNIRKLLSTHSTYRPTPQMCSQQRQSDEWVIISYVHTILSRKLSHVLVPLNTWRWWLANTLFRRSGWEFGDTPRSGQLVLLRRKFTLTLPLLRSGQLTQRRPPVCSVVGRCCDTIYYLII